MSERPQPPLPSIDPQHWASTPTGLLIPAHLRPRYHLPSRSYADTVIQYWKVCLTSKEVLNQQPSLKIASKILSLFPIRFTLALLSRAAFTLAITPNEHMLEVQKRLAPNFFPEGILRKVDAWIRNHPAYPHVYLLGDHQLLTAMIIVLQKANRTIRITRPDPPHSSIGSALLHVSGLLEPLQVRVPQSEFTALSDDQKKRKFIELIIRNGLFYEHEEYRYMISRYYKMFSHIAGRLNTDPNFLDFPTIFRQCTGIKLKTYLHLGVALLGAIDELASDRNGPSLINLRTLQPPRHLRRLWLRFKREVMASRAQLRRSHYRTLALSPISEYNFLAAEFHPIVAISKKAACCLSIKYLQRKFGIGIMHRVSASIKESQRTKLRSFVGNIFATYVQDLCQRTFHDLFFCNISYENSKEAGDGWILYPPDAILIEAKSGYLLLETTLSGDFEGFERTFRQTLLKAAGQLSRVIDDFRDTRFQVGRIGTDKISTVYPVIVTLRYFPLEKFLWDYMQNEISVAGYLKQPGVAPLTILPIKDLERVECLSVSFLDLVKERLANDAWRYSPFGNFLYDRIRRAGTDIPVNSFLIECYRELCAGSGKLLFNVDLARQGKAHE